MTVHRMFPTKPHLVASAIATLSFYISACQSTLEVKKIDWSNPGNDEGMRYRLQIPVMKVSTLEKLVYDDTKDPKKPRRVTDAKVDLALVADYKHAYSVTTKPGWFTSDGFGITFAENGGLQSYNVKSEDQTTSVVADFGKIAVTAAEFASIVSVNNGHVELKSNQSPKLESVDPNFVLGTYEVDETDRRLLASAIAQVRLLRRKINREECEKIGDSLDRSEMYKCDQGYIDEKEREGLIKLLSAISELQKALFKEPKQVTSVAFAPLTWLCDGESVENALEKFSENLTDKNVQLFVALARRIPAR